jgi:nitroimidazol reductase NimA-like FMN-containing flavoprotein (pyridoxamine 5'-phosphate oxidase superfamily)
VAGNKNSIKMSPTECREYLASHDRVVLNTQDPSGYIHSVPLWYRLDGETLQLITYAKSRKVDNILRNGKVSLLIDSGDRYEQLQGVLVYANATVITDPELVKEVLFVSLGVVSQSEGVEAVSSGLLKSLDKRVVIACSPQKYISWDHSKLGGSY